MSTKATVTLPEDIADDTEPIHGHFGLSYANYLVLNRTLLQSMPVEWQRPFVALLRELDEAFAHVERAACYDVTAGEEREIGELSDAEMQLLGVQPPTPIEEQGPDETTEEYDARYETWREDCRWLYRGEEYADWERIVFPKPDPVPHYRRGRTRVEPQRKVTADA